MLTFEGFLPIVFSLHYFDFYPRMENVRQCGVALCIMLGFSILTASIGTGIVKDRASGTKRLQHITGLGYKTYWLANFFCDMVCIMWGSMCSGVNFRLVSYK